jgi:serine/threonine protein kinase
VSTLDGRLTALQGESGARLWSLSTGREMVHATQAAQTQGKGSTAKGRRSAAGAGAGGGLNSNDTAPLIVPSRDGSILVADKDGALHQLPYRAQDLVNQLPFASQGNILVGFKRTRAIEVDLGSGRVLRSIASTDDPFAAMEEEEEEEDDGKEAEDWAFAAETGFGDVWEAGATCGVQGQCSGADTDNCAEEAEGRDARRRTAEGRGDAAEAEEDEEVLLPEEGVRARRRPDDAEPSTCRRRHSSSKPRRRPRAPVYSLWIGRSDYSVRAYDTVSRRQIWNLTYSELAPPDSLLVTGTPVWHQPSDAAPDAPGMRSRGDRQSSTSKDLVAASRAAPPHPLGPGWAPRTALPGGGYFPLQLSATMAGELLAADANSGAFAWQSELIGSPVVSIHAVLTPAAPPATAAIGQDGGDSGANATPTAPPQVPVPFQVPFSEIWPACGKQKEDNRASAKAGTEGGDASPTNVPGPIKHEVFIGMMASGQLYALSKNARTLIDENMDPRMAIESLLPRSGGALALPWDPTDGSAAGSMYQLLLPAGEGDADARGKSGSGKHKGSDGAINVDLTKRTATSSEGRSALIFEEWQRVCGAQADSAPGTRSRAAVAQCLLGLHNVTLAFAVDPLGSAVARRSIASALGVPWQSGRGVFPLGKNGVARLLPPSTAGSASSYYDEFDATVDVPRSPASSGVDDPTGTAVANRVRAALNRPGPGYLYTDAEGAALVYYPSTGELLQADEVLSGLGQPMQGSIAPPMARSPVSAVVGSAGRLQTLARSVAALFGSTDAGIEQLASFFELLIIIGSSFVFAIGLTIAFVVQRRTGKGLLSALLGPSNSANSGKQGEQAWKSRKGASKRGGKKSKDAGNESAGQDSGMASPSLSSSPPPEPANSIVLSEQSTVMTTSDGNARAVAVESRAVIDGMSYRVIGRLAISEQTLGFGCHGTVVYRGLFDSRPVAVKRLLRTFHPAASREISLLVRTDGHPHVVRYFACEEAADFVYLALELCEGSLAEAVAKCARSRAKAAARVQQQGTGNRPALQSPTAALRNGQALRQLLDISDDEDDNDSSPSTRKSLTVYQLSGSRLPVPMPTPSTRNFLRDLVAGIAHLHQHRIVHRDIKPHNILLARKSTSHPNDPIMDLHENKTDGLYPDKEYHRLGEFFTPKISDFGLGKQLSGDSSSFGASHKSSFFMQQKTNRVGDANGLQLDGDNSTFSGAAPGSVGWQAPEMLAMVLRQRSLAGVSVLPAVPEDGNLDPNHMGEGAGEADPNAETRSPAEAEDEDAEAAAAAALSSDPAVADGTISISSTGTSSSGKKLASASSIPADPQWRRSRAADIWSLGCVLYNVIDAGAHPFGEAFEREANIIKGIAQLSRLQHTPEAHALISSMLATNPALRPSASLILEHPFFWDDEKRLNFLQEVSDRLESEPLDSLLTAEFEKRANAVVGTGWNKRLPQTMMTEMGKRRTYNFSSLADCLRLLRNQRNHYNDLPLNIRHGILGSESPLALVPFFLAPSRFPGLLMTCYDLVIQYLAHEPKFAHHLGRLSVHKHSQRSRQAWQALLDTMASQAAANLVASTVTARADRASAEVGVSKANGAEPSLTASSGVATGERAFRGWFMPEANWLEFSSDRARHAEETGRMKVSVTKEKLEDGSEDRSSGPSYVLVPCAYERVNETTFKGGAHTTHARYKCQPCKDWDNNGGAFCPRGVRCDFAHGLLELRLNSGRQVSLASVEPGDLSLLGTSMVTSAVPMQTRTFLF